MRWKRMILAVSMGWLLVACQGSRQAGDVILIVLDTVRADRLGVDGYSRPTTPNLDRIAREGEYHANAWAQSPWTLPSIATILTGQPPHVHGAGMSGGRIHPVRPSQENLAEILAGRGYRTGAVVNVIFCGPRSGLSRGFDSYDFHGAGASNRGHRSAAATTDAALAWVRSIGEHPAFLVVHYFDAHLTYDPPAPHDTLFEPDGNPAIPEGFGSAAEVMDLRSGRIRLSPRQKISLMARYDGEIRYLDQEIGRLRDGLVDAGRWDQALVLVVGDHGEEFWDHGGFEHGHTHHQELLRIPLIVRRPGGAAGKVRTGLARQLDVVPTVLEFTGIEAPADLPGQALGPEGAEHSLAEGSLWSGELRSVRTARGTLLRGPDGEPHRFYLPDDPGELRDVHGRHAEVESELQTILESISRRADRDSTDAWVPDEAELDELRSLGYVR